MENLDFLKEKYAIISVMGPHAGETSDEIFHRKINDVKSIGKTLWVVKSYKAKPNIINALVTKAKNENLNPYCIFIEPSTKGGARPTVTTEQATYFSEDKIHWEPLPPRLSQVTGKIDKNSYALVFDELQLLNENASLNLWNYAEFENQSQPIRPELGTSIICSVLKDMSNHPRSEERRVGKA